MKEQGLMVITLLTETENYSIPTVADLKSWADSHGSNHPVVADVEWGVTYRYASGTIYLPSMHLIGPGMKVRAVQTRFSKAQIEQELLR